MAASKNTPAADEGDDLLAGLGGTSPAGSEDDFADIDDLLNEVEEDDSEGWVPTEVGEGIAGRVVRVGTVKSDFAGENEDPNCPVVTIQNKDGKFRIIGYGSVLKRELIEKDPQIGGTLAVKYFGEKPIRKGKFAGKPYKHYGVAYKKPASAV